MAKCKLTPDVSNAILGFIARGSTDAMACDAAGVDQSTFYRWIRNGEDAKSGVYHQFSQNLKKARAAAFQSNLDQIRRAATEKQILKTTRITTHPDGTETKVEELKETPKQWQAAAWLLERKYPELFSRNRTVQDAEDDKPLPWTGNEDADQDIGKLTRELEEYTEKQNAELEALETQGE